MKEAIHLLRKVQVKDRYFGGLYMIELHSTEHFEDKPIYAGTSSLDISTLCMINLHYNRIQTYFDCKNIQMQLLWMLQSHMLIYIYECINSSNLFLIFTSQSEQDLNMAPTRNKMKTIND